MKLTELYRQRHKTIERYVRRLLGNGDDAADVSQEVFLRAYAAELGDATPMSEALLYTVARNLALTELRKRTFRATDAMGDLADLQLYDPGGNPEAHLERQQMIAAIPLCQTSCRLLFHGGCSAGATNMNQKTHSPEFKEQALRKLRERGNRTQQSVADELNICLSTLKGWLQGSKKMARGLPHGANPLSTGVEKRCFPGFSERFESLSVRGFY